MLIQNNETDEFYTLLTAEKVWYPHIWEQDLLCRFIQRLFSLYYLPKISCPSESLIAMCGQMTSPYF